MIVALAKSYSRRLNEEHRFPNFAPTYNESAFIHALGHRYSRRLIGLICVPVSPGSEDHCLTFMGANVVAFVTRAIFVDEEAIAGMNNVIKFPGYLHPNRKSYWHACKHYTAFKDLLGDLSEAEIGRMTKWH